MTSNKTSMAARRSEPKRQFLAFSGEKNTARAPKIVNV